MTLSSLPDRVSLRIPLTQRVPFQVIESEQTLSLRFYSAVADVDWIRYGRDTLIQRLGWSQTGTDELSFTAELTQPVWGYRTRWDRNDLLLEIRRPPSISSSHPLRGRRIAPEREAQIVVGARRLGGRFKLGRTRRRGQHGRRLPDD